MTRVSTPPSIAADTAPPAPEVCPPAAWHWLRLLPAAFYWLPLLFGLDHLTGAQLAAQLLLFVAFVMVCHWAFNSQGRSAVLAAASLALLCVAGTCITPGTMALFGFVANLAGARYSLASGFAGLMTTLVLILVSALLFDQWNAFFLSPAILVCLTHYGFGLFERKTRQHQAREAASQAQIEHLAAVAERERIARDLHDLLGHSLSSIALKADLADKLGQRGDTARALAEIQQVAAITRDTLAQVRQAVSGYKARDAGAELDRLAGVLRQQGFAVDVDADLKGLTARAESSILLILKEATTNILRHCRGNHVRINTKRHAEGFRLSISDDGDATTPNPGNGLRGIEERVAELGGTLTINPNRGITLEMTFDNGVFAS